MEKVVMEDKMEKEVGGGRRNYGREELLEIFEKMAKVGVARNVRRCLFRLKVWNPRWERVKGRKWMQKAMQEGLGERDERGEQESVVEKKVSRGSNRRSVWVECGRGEKVNTEAQEDKEIRKEEGKIAEEDRGLKVKVASWNVGTLNGRVDEVLGSLGKWEVDVCCLQETRWGGAEARFWEKRVKGKKNSRCIGRGEGWSWGSGSNG